MNAKYLSASFAIVSLCAAVFGQSQPGTLLWSYDAGSTITTSPALAPDGTIYIGTQLGLYAITNAGSNKWTFAANLKGSPAIGNDGTVYFGDYPGTFYALNTNGSMIWQFQAPGRIWSSPAIGFDNSLYFVGGGWLIALDPAGTQKWRYQVGDGTGPVQATSPVVGRDGTIYVGPDQSHLLLAVNPGGTRKWLAALDSLPGESAAIGRDSTVYTTGGGLYAFSPTGSSYWETTVPLGSSPIISPGGTIYAAQPNNFALWSIKPNGETNWSACASSASYASPPPAVPVIDRSGTIYYCSSNAVFAITPQGQVQWVFTTPLDFPQLGGVSSPAIGADGTIYACFDNKLYALFNTNKLADSPWPMYRQNARHTGKIEKPFLQQPKKRADAGFQFQLMSQFGSTNEIDTSPDLAVWSPLTNIVITNVPLDFIDWDASNFSRRFYRTFQQ